MRRLIGLFALTSVACFGEPDGGDSSSSSGDADSSGAADTSPPVTGGPATTATTMPATTLDSSGDTAGTSATSDSTGEADSTGAQACNCPYENGHCDDQGRCALWVFVSSTAMGGHFAAGRDDADDICMDLATRAELPGQFRALLALGGDLAEAFDRAGVQLGLSQAWVVPDTKAGSIVVADSVAQLRIDVDRRQTLTHVIDRNELGELVDPTLSLNDGFGTTWTGMSLDPMDTADCGGWIAGNNGDLGRQDRDNSSWAASLLNGSCADVTAHLYCFELPPPPK